MSIRTVICQKWVESERGWGQKPDGYSLHANKAALDKYVKEYNRSLPKEVPEIYDRISGVAYEVNVKMTDKQWKQMQDNDGIRFYDEPKESIVLKTSKSG